MRLIITFFAVCFLLAISQCIMIADGSNDETVTGTISLVGKVLNSQNIGESDVVVKLSKIPFSDTTNVQGEYKISASKDTLEALGIDLDTLKDTLIYIKDSVIITSNPVTEWVDILPDVYIIQRCVSGQLLTTYKEFSIIEAVLNDLDNKLIPPKRSDLWLSTNTLKYSGFLYFLYDKKLKNYSIYVNIYDKDSVFVGRSMTEVFKSNAGNIELAPFDPFNAYPQVDLGKDTTVSIGDSIYLHPIVVDSFGGTIESWEWSIDGKPFAPAAQENKYIIAPLDSTSLYQCLLRVTDNDGNQTIDTVQATVVLDIPIVDVGKDTTLTINDTVLLPSRITQQFGSITLYKWDFDGDGIFDDSSTTTADILHVYKHEATYRAVLWVRDDDGNEASDTIVITVQNRPPIITYLRNDTTISLFDTIAFVGMASDSDATSLYYSWDYNGDGTFEYNDSTSGTTQFSYGKAGLFPAVFRVRDDDHKEARDTVIITVVVDPPVASASTTTPIVSLFDTLQFLGAATDHFGTITQWEWDIGNTGTFVPANNGTGYITLAPASGQNNYQAVLRVTDDDGNRAFDTVGVKVLADIPVAKASTATEKVSINDPLILQGTASDTYGWITTWEWDIGNNGSFVPANNDSGHTVDAPSTACDSYECVLRVIDNDDNSALDTVSIVIVADIPVAKARTTTPKVSINDSIQLQGSAIDEYGYIVSWEWDMGNKGHFVTANNDSGHTWNAPSTAFSSYQCVLRITDDDDNIALDTVSIEVVADIPIATARTTTPKVSINDTIQVQGSATDEYGYIVSWEWDMGNTGSFAPANNDSGYIQRAPSSASPSFECVLRVTDNDGNTALDTVSIEVVADIPVATASTTTPKASINDAIHLQGTATDEYGYIVSWEWDMGNTGSFVLANNDSGHTWNAPTTAFSSYKCILRVKDDDGNTAFDTVSIEVVDDIPVATASTTTPKVSINDAIHLQGTATDEYGYIVSWEWDMGNTGDFVTANNDSGHIWNAPSTAFSSYKCILRITDNDGKSDLDTVSIEVVDDIPVATASTTTPTVSINDAIHLQGAATDIYGYIVSWEWDIGNDGTFVPANNDNGLTAKAPSTAASSYECVLRVKDDDGNTAFDTVAIEVVKDIPVATASTTTTNVIINDPILLNGTATDIFGSIVKWEWDIGNTGVFIETTPDSNYTASAPSTPDSSFKCILRVTDDDDNLAYDTVNIIVLPNLARPIGYLIVQLADSQHTDILPIKVPFGSSLPSFQYPAIGAKSAVAIDACSYDSICYCDQDGNVWELKDGNFQENNFILNSKPVKMFDVALCRTGFIGTAGEIINIKNCYMFIDQEWHHGQGIAEKVDVAHSQFDYYCIGMDYDIFYLNLQHGWQKVGNLKGKEITRGEKLYIITTDNQVNMWDQQRWESVTGPFAGKTLLKIESNDKDEIIVIDDMGTFYYKDSQGTWYTLPEYGGIDRIIDLTLF